LCCQLKNSAHHILDFSIVALMIEHVHHLDRNGL